MSALIRQRSATTLEDVGAQLLEAFESVRGAVTEGEPSVIVVNAPDLIGQGTLEDAAVATGLLGLMRAITFEGASKGWRVNVVAVDRDADPPVEVLESAMTTPGLMGQVLNVAKGMIGKVVP